LLREVKDINPDRAEARNIDLAHGPDCRLSSRPKRIRRVEHGTRVGFKLGRSSSTGQSRVNYQGRVQQKWDAGETRAGPETGRITAVLKIKARASI
jgi:hypothetical protein